jgi:hypothetical protein
MLKPCGTYRQVVAYASEERIYGQKNIYDIRRHYLPLVGNTVIQVWVWSCGYLVWINVDEKDITLIAGWKMP